MSVVILSPSKDSYVDQGNPNTNYGTLGYLIAGKSSYIDINSTTLARIWIQFDLSSLAGSVINTAKLTINGFSTTNGYSPETYNLQRCTDTSWTETGITWNNAPNASVIAGISGSFSTIYTAFGQIFTGLSSDVSTALASGKISYRIIDSNESSLTGFAITSREYSSVGNPLLEIDYTPPVVSTAGNMLVFFK